MAFVLITEKKYSEVVILNSTVKTKNKIYNNYFLF